MAKRMHSETTHVGTILSGGSTSESAFQPFDKYENDLIEGKLVVVHYERTGSEVLGRISSIIPYNAFYSEGDAFSCGSLCAAGIFLAGKCSGTPKRPAICHDQVSG